MSSSELSREPYELPYWRMVKLNLTEAVGQLQINSKPRKNLNKQPPYPPPTNSQKNERTYTVWEINNTGLYSMLGIEFLKVRHSMKQESVVHTEEKMVKY